MPQGLPGGWAQQWHILHGAGLSPAAITTAAPIPGAAHNPAGSSQGQHLETVLLVDQSLDFRFKTAIVCFVSQSLLTALTGFILPWELAL